MSLGQPAETADVTVVIPAYNRGAHLGRALDSIARQVVRPREVIVVDDCSTDDTVQVAVDHGVKVLQTPVNSGSGPARNLGVESATTRWIAFLDSDDEWHEDHLATLLAAAEGQVLVVSAGFTTTGTLLGNPMDETLQLDASLVLETSELVVTSAVLASRDALVAAGLFRPLRRAQDLDMWVRLLQEGPGRSLPERTITYHVHDEQASLDSDLMMACFRDIVDACEQQPWFGGSRGRTRSFARIEWDLLREAQRSGRRAEAVRHAAWLGTHPAAWRPLTTLLRIRRHRRHAKADPLSGRPHQLR